MDTDMDMGTDMDTDKDTDMDTDRDTDIDKDTAFGLLHREEFIKANMGRPSNLLSPDLTSLLVPLFSA
jgi:hypothetical protein